jgi:protein-disulfide isomerase
MTKNPNYQNGSSNNNLIAINRNLFLVLIVVLALLAGAGGGFALGQYSAARNFMAMQETIAANAQAQQPEIVYLPQPAPLAEDQPAAVEAPEEFVELEPPPTPEQAVEPQLPQVPERQEISVDDDPYLGPEDAPVTIVEFSDYQCSYCARFHIETMDALLEAYPDEVRFVYRDYPLLGSHPEAQKASEAAQCANDQGNFWEMHDLLFSNQGSLGSESYALFAEQLGLDMDAFSACLEDGKYEEEVLADLDDGLSYGVTGTPTFFVNGVMLLGAQPLEAFAGLIEEELQK